jgi:hypothetical protein
MIVDLCIAGHRDAGRRHFVRANGLDQSEPSRTHPGTAEQLKERQGQMVGGQGGKVARPPLHHAE